MINPYYDITEEKKEVENVNSMPNLSSINIESCVDEKQLLLCENTFKGNY